MTKCIYKMCTCTCNAQTWDKMLQRQPTAESQWCVLEKVSGAVWSPGFWLTGIILMAHINLMMSLPTSNRRWAPECLQPDLNCVWRDFWTSLKTTHWNVNGPVWLHPLPLPASRPAWGPRAPRPHPTRASRHRELDRISSLNVVRGRRPTGLCMCTHSSSTPVR